MSIQFMQYAMEDDRLSIYEGMLLVVMGDMANDEGDGIYPSNETLAHRGKMSVRKVRSTLGDLTEKGYLKKVGRTEWGTNIWHINRAAFRGDVVSPPGTPCLPPGTVCHQDSNSNNKSNLLVDILVEDNTTTSLEAQDATPGISEIVGTWESIGMLITPFAGETFQHWMSEFPSEWIVDAIKEAARQNKRTLSYVGGILRNWKAKGGKQVQARIVKNDYNVLLVAVEGEGEGNPWE